jgi:hypothetical protein
MISMSIKLEGVKEAMEALNPAKVQRAVKMALNDAARAGRTEAGKAIRDKWNVKAAKIADELKNVRLATNDDFTAIIQAKGRPISLAYYGAKEVRRITRTKRGKQKKVRGVTLQVLKGIRVSYPKAFMATMKNGYVGVFMNHADFFRTGYSYHAPTVGKYAGKKGRSKIVGMATITIASMFNQPRVQEAAVKKISETWKSRFSHHLNRLEAGR